MVYFIFQQHDPLVENLGEYVKVTIRVEENKENLFAELHGKCLYIREETQKNFCICYSLVTNTILSL